jgi:hypothetical protein
MNRSIIEDYKVGIFHNSFSVFHCKELDKYFVKREPIKADEELKY